MLRLSYDYGLRPYSITMMIINKDDKIFNDWLRGFTDAEGCFNVHISMNSTMKLGEQCQLRFIIDQNRLDIQILEEIKNYFGSGTINKYGVDSSQVVICAKNTIINKVVPFFKKNQLLTSKKLDFDLWTKCAHLMKEKKHLTREGLDLIKSINEHINNKTESRIELLPKGPINLSKGWVLGFLEGDGSFYIDISEKGKSFKVQPRLKVGLHVHEKYILESLKKFFQGAGQINETGVTPHWYIRGIHNCYAYVLPFFDANPPLTIKKSKEYELFREVVLLCKEKTHLTPKGEERLRAIKKELNRYKEKE